ICGHSMGWAVRAKSARITAMTAQQARRYILENVQRNMILLDVKGALTAQLASYSVMRDERAIDNLYADLRAAGVRLPRIVGPVFEVEGYQVGEGETQCFVSLSLDDPDHSRSRCDGRRSGPIPVRRRPTVAAGCFSTARTR
ncbi:MAG: hypothetical protein NTV97_24640, partial [Alphaproteobacteria bacterium]|nr:hypothetical protein [Alphaproteobacteria bacterium]